MLWVLTELILLPVLQDTSAVSYSCKIDVQKELAKMRDYDPLWFFSVLPLAHIIQEPLITLIPGTADAAGHLQVLCKESIVVL